MIRQQNCCSCGPDVTLGYTVAVVDAGKVKVYTKNFGEFYNNQVETASTIILSHTDKINKTKLDAAVEILREHNAVATVITTPWSELTGEQLISAMEGKASLAAELAKLESERLEAEEEEEEHHHHHHDDDDDDDEDAHEHHHHHHHDDEDDEHAHHHPHDEDDDEHEHHHDHDGHCCCHDHEEHEHHHHHDEDEHDENCTCGCHDHHHHHHADEVFTSWGKETPHKFTKEQIEEVLKTLCETDDYGEILRAKGMVADVNGSWIYFDMVPGEYEIREGEPDYTGRLCVIGTHIDEHRLEELFGIA